jgi:hypothetical protein
MPRAKTLRNEARLHMPEQKKLNRSKQMRWIIVIGAIALIGILAYSSLQATMKKYEVCMSFHGASHCSTATGTTPEEAIRSAQGIDCQLVTSGRDELMACMDQSPSSTREIK